MWWMPYRESGARPPRCPVGPGNRDHDLTVGSYVVIPGPVNHSRTVPEGGNEAVILLCRAAACGISSGPELVSTVDIRRSAA